jgi:flavin reductase (DIM6/NTAB) family NADH-FMN oxidoreductase RutF
MEKPAGKEDEAARFKQGMRSLAGTVTLITSAHASHRYGMTATAVCSATADPPTVLVCVNKSTTTHDAIVKSGAFCVNVLRYEDRELSTLFGGAEKGEARFKSDQWTHLITGSPVLLSSLVSFDCSIAKKISHGTHSIFLGAVQHLLIGKKGKPLLYADGQYAKLAPAGHGEALPEGLDYWGE